MAMNKAGSMAFSWHLPVANCAYKLFTGQLEPSHPNPRHLAKTQMSDRLNAVNTSLKNYAMLWQ